VGFEKENGGSRLTDVVGTDLEGLVPSHDKTDLARLRLKDLDLSGSSLLPLGSGLVESEELGSPVHVRQMKRKEPSA
jgi:hypothetical protein